MITYTYHGVTIGKVRVNFTGRQNQTQIFDSEDGAEDGEDGGKKEKPVIYVNIVRVLIGAACVGAVVLAVVLIRLFLKNFQFAGWKSRREWKRNNRRRRKKARRPNRFRDYDF